MKFKDVVISEASTEAKVAALALLLDKELIKLADTVLNVKKLQGPQGEQGLQGPKGEQGDRGFDGTNGKDGVDGKDGKDGQDGKQGVGVADAKIDFDGSLVITLTDGTEINAGDVVPLDTAEKIRVIGNGGGTSQSVLDAIDAINAVIATYGTMATQNDTAVDINGGAIDGTAIGATVPATGVFTTLGVTTSINASGASANVDLNLASKGTGVVNVKDGSVTVAKFLYETASDTSFWKFRSRSGDGLNVGVVADGTASNIGFNISTKGTAASRFFTGDTGGFSGGVEQFRVSNTASAVNYVQVTGAATTKATVVSSAGSDSNISSVFQSKGTGAIDLAAGSSGVNISNGGTVTAITGTSAGSGYTSIPSVAITAPTTAGGVQAVVEPRMQTGGASPTIVSGGTGYTAGDVLTVVGGTGTAATITVSTVSAGVITAAVNTTGGTYSVLPTNPVSVTGGTGSGATFNLVYAVRTSSFVITNAGSGYVEQPTVSFSGGGGSGAAAYATVGSTTVIKSIGATLDLFTSVGRVGSFSSGSSVANQAYFNIFNNATNVGYYAAGSSSNISATFVTQGTSPLNFATNSTSGNQQFAVAHTASAVNYVQVTGATTGNDSTISAQGSDANTGLIFLSKGSTGLTFRTRGGGTARNAFVMVDNGASSVNYLASSSNVTGSAPILSSQGTDTNIDLTLTPKGTGNVRFGTLTASADAPITGYITIKDSGGTVRKLAVIA